MSSLLGIWGIVFTFTVNAASLVSVFDLSRLEVSSVFSVTTAAFFVAAGAIGILTARMRVRPVIATAGFAIAVAFGFLHVVTSYGGLVVAFGLS